MISRIWHGYTTCENADAYESLFKEEISVGIKDRHMPGFQEIQLLRREHGDEVEFITLMWFDDLEAVRAFAGEDHEAAVVPDKARKVLKRFDTRSQHFEVRKQLKGS